MEIKIDEFSQRVDDLESEVTEIVDGGSDNSKYNSPRPNQGPGAMNPFNEELGAQKLSDSNQMQDSYHDTGSGWIPYMANNKKPIKLSIWDNSQVPGSPYMGRDRGEAWGGPGSAMAPAPFRNKDDSPEFNKLIRPSDKGFNEIPSRNPETEKADQLELRLKFPEANTKSKILKISSDDDYWMPSTIKKVGYISSEFSNKLGETYGSAWRYIQPVKEGNTLRCQWASGNGLNIRKFISHIRYNAGSNSYLVSSSAYDGETNQEKTLVNWTDSVHTATLMNPNIWIKGE
jgi:hypothetical protein